MQRFLDLLISINCSTCFRRFIRPSSGAQNCTVLVWQYLTLYVQFCASDNGRKNLIKHVEQFIEIIRSRKVASFWLYFRDCFKFYVKVAWWLYNDKNLSQKKLLCLTETNNFIIVFQIIYNSHCEKSNA
jgi:hypothetical protein